MYKLHAEYFFLKGCLFMSFLQRFPPSEKPGIFFPFQNILYVEPYHKDLILQDICSLHWFWTHASVLHINHLSIYF